VSEQAQRIAVLGAGVMGVGITTLAVAHGLPVTLVDVDATKLASAAGRVKGQLRMAALMGGAPTDRVAAIEVTTSVDDLAGVSAVIEAVTELPELKAKVLADVTAVIAPGTPVVTNTSAIPVDELASALARPADLAGAHFMNPPYLIGTVEVIRGPRTADAALSTVLGLLAAMGREAVVVADCPGFVINRVLQRMINEAARIVQEGVASPTDVDALFRGCLGHRTGPLATADLIGLDNVADSLRVLRDRTGDDGYEPCALLLDKVAAGDHGRKTGRGFFDHGGVQS
jgi:methoxymalonate biosynthesis protein